MPLSAPRLQVVGEELCEALDLRSASKVLDVAAGNGMITLNGVGSRKAQQRAEAQV
jgi:ubiquinone/menaquinone biosynthesis C-methylase UbiE